jgi:hypothetical protein
MNLKTPNKLLQNLSHLPLEGLTNSNTKLELLVETYKTPIGSTERQNLDTHLQRVRESLWLSDRDLIIQGGHGITPQISTLYKNPDGLKRYSSIIRPSSTVGLDKIIVSSSGIYTPESGLDYMVNSRAHNYWYDIFLRMSNYRLELLDSSGDVVRSIPNQSITNLRERYSFSKTPASKVVQTTQSPIERTIGFLKKGW